MWGESMRSTRLLVVAMLLLCWASAYAQSPDKTAAKEPDSEPAAILEFGGAVSHGLNGGGASGGPNFAVEVTPVENWLELEAGVTPLFSRGTTEWDTDLLFKKPWTLSPKAEFMAGVGPEWIHTSDRGVTTNAAGIEAAADFMFWPSGKHRYGWYLEPAYDYSFGAGREQSIGVSFGLLIGIGKR